MSREINTIKDLMNDEELMSHVTEDLEDFDLESTVTYEVWAIGYDEGSAITDTDMFIGEFADPDKAIEKAKALTLADIIHQAAEEDNGAAPAENVAYISIEVETVVDDEDGEETMNVGTIYKRELWIDGEYGNEEDALEDEYSEVIPITNKEYTLLEDGSIEVDCEVLKNFNKNDMVQFMFVEENKDITPILTYKIISKTTSNKFTCEFIY
jgi:hypothetical protein